MNQLLDKIRLIFIPFVITTLCSVVGYTFLNWIVSIVLRVNIPEEIACVWIPFTLIAVVVYFILYPRVKLLHFTSENTCFIYILGMWLVIAFSTMSAQEYMFTSTGKLTHLEDITQIDDNSYTKYYTLDRSNINKNHIGSQYRFNVTGKHNDNFVVSIYIVMPIQKRYTDIVQADHKYWLAKSYSKTINNNLSNKEKDLLSNRFIEEVNRDIRTRDFKNFTFLEVLGNTSEYRESQKALDNLKLVQTTEGKVFFKAHIEPFEERSGGTFKRMLIVLGIGSLGIFLAIVFRKLDQRKVDDFKAKKTKIDYKSLYFLLPKKDFFVTPIVLYLCIMVYVYMAFTYVEIVSFDGEDLLAVGGNYRPLVLEGQWWRLITNIFIHGGMLHLAYNMIALTIIGVFLERLIGSVKLGIVYLITGVFASLCSILWHDATVSVGASGAILGLAGFYVVYLLSKTVHRKNNKDLLVLVSVFIGVNLLMGLTEGIDNAAHIGGLISGLILGLFMSKYVRDEE
jgi:membrane associated rhomboid family serine protease